MATTEQIVHTLERMALRREHATCVTDKGRRWAAAEHEALRAAITALSQPVADAVGREIRDAYDIGWIECTNWAKRDDLVADMDSPAYMADRSRNLAALASSGMRGTGEGV